jgi:hypothetical protein
MEHGLDLLAAGMIFACGIAFLIWLGWYILSNHG